jgi:hypothetical protein
MLRLSALALGPLLARAAPKIGSGIVDTSTTISNWLTEQYTHQSDTLVTALTRSVDRSWRSLEVALGGGELHRGAIDAVVDRALIEQIRQFIAVISWQDLTREFRFQVINDIRSARKKGIIPGPVPSVNALTTRIVRFLDGVSEETPEADCRELVAFAVELRTSGFDSLARFFDLLPSNKQPLLVTAVRYFLSREISADLWLLRDLRFTRTELIPDGLRSGFDRLADAFDRFTTILIELLAQLTASINLPSPIPPSATVPAPSSVSPPQTEVGFSIHGTHLVAPIRPGLNGSRITPCPVCLTPAMLPPSSGGWVSLRCDTCGTEFQATDGTVPAPALPLSSAARTDAVTRSRLQARNLQSWIESGKPELWIEYRKGMWGEKDFEGLTEMLRFSRFWPLDLVEVRKALVKMTSRFKSKGTKGWGLPSPRASGSSTGSTSIGLIRTSDFYRTVDGNYWVPCPLCRSFNVEIPPWAISEIRLTCSGCGREFVLDLKKRPKPLSLPPPLTPPPTFWNKVRKWFGG